jgi:hippurate hydrolase
VIDGEPNVMTEAPHPWAGETGALAPRLHDLRHRLHRRPETGLHLPLTRDAVLTELGDLGLEVTLGISCSSVTAVLRGAAPDDGRGAGRDPEGRRPVVLLRGDMDALPVQELTDLPFRSETDGVMHACGHDLHTAVLAGAARLLAAHRDELAVDVVFMFQPGEEGYDGAAHMIAEGVLDAAGRRADAAFALHVISNLAPRGSVLWRPGPIMAASDGLIVTVRGRGGHGSSPHLSRDPLPAASEMVLALTHALARGLDAFEPAVLTVGTFHAGTQRNIIAPTAVFEATLRTFDPAVRSRVRALAERVCEGIAAAHGVTAELDFRTEYPVTSSDPARAEFVAATARRLFGAERVVGLPNPIMGSEDFSRVLAEIPGAMFFLGACPGGSDPRTAPGNHCGDAEFDDAAIEDGALLLAVLAAGDLGRGPAQNPRT